MAPQAATILALAALLIAACTYTPITPEMTAAHHTPQVAPAATPTAEPTRTLTAEPTQTPTATLPASTIVVQGNHRVNLRRGPSLQHQILGQASPGEEFTALGKNSAGDWYAIEWDGARVWIFAQLVSLENDADLPVITTGIPAAAPPTATPAPAAIIPAPPGCELAWNDEFDVDGLPSVFKWRYDVAPNDWDLGQLQYYTAFRSENARVEDGRLIIEARHESFEGRSYTSARLLSRQEWTYGRFEVSAKLPSDGRGLLPAIWMLGNGRTYGRWPASGEIDIMEHVGHEPDRIYAHIHTEAYNHRIRTHKGRATMLPTARTEFSLYVLEWTPSAIKVFVNDTHYFTFENERLTNPDADYRHWPFDNRHHMILNITVGGNWVGNQNVDPSHFPQRMEIDFVRVYDCGE